MLKNLLKATIFVGLLIALGEFLPINDAGNSYEFKLKDSTHSGYWLAKLANPCGASSVIKIKETRQDPVEFYQSMIMAIELALVKLQAAESASHNIFLCSGLNLDSLPSTPSLSNLALNDSLAQVYQSGISLVVHLEIMILDRETKNGMKIGHEGRRKEIIHCGTESEDFLNFVADLIKQVEDILCTLVAGGTTSAFRTHLNKLMNTKINRYSSACINFEIRDCIVFRETRQTLKQFLSKFNEIILMFNSQIYSDDQLMSLEGNAY